MDIVSWAAIALAAALVVWAYIMDRRENEDGDMWTRSQGAWVFAVCLVAGALMRGAK